MHKKEAGLDDVTQQHLVGHLVQPLHINCNTKKAISKMAFCNAVWVELILVVSATFSCKGVSFHVLICDIRRHDQPSKEKWVFPFVSWSSSLVCLAILLRDPPGRRCVQKSEYQRSCEIDYLTDRNTTTILLTLPQSSGKYLIN